VKFPLTSEKDPQLEQSRAQAQLANLSDKKKIFLEGHGCSASLADTEILGGLISSSGYDLVESPEEADLSVIVTCTVKSVTEQRMLSRIRELSSDRTKPIVVAGCLPKASPQKLWSIDPLAAVIGPSNLEKIVPAIEASISRKKFESLENERTPKLLLPRSRKNSVVGIVEILSGCLSSCTFCQVKLVKGVLYSYPERMILQEVKNLLEQGSKEIWLTSTDNGCYGRDIGSSLPRLLQSVVSLREDFMVRVGMMNPLVTERIASELTEAYRSDKVFRFLHLPVQSGSDRILRRMQRGYLAEDFRKMVKLFRSKIPNMTLSTDVIVGFPSESESDFEATLQLLREIQPDIVNISRFGARDGTKAALMPEQVDPTDSKSRSSRTTNLVREISALRNREWVGWRGPILVDELARGGMVGRNFAYKPCVLDRAEIENIALDNPGSLLGTWVEVEIVSATSHTLRARLLEKPSIGQA
jgi:threonylcarbamoyladenosine tRNA methylthiotransferase CDKAL1